MDAGHGRHRADYHGCRRDSIEDAGINAPVAQLDRAPGFEPGGREFESLRARHSLDRVQGHSSEAFGDEVLMKDPDFRRHFTVHSRDQVEVRYVPSVSLIDRIPGFRPHSD